MVNEGVDLFLFCNVIGKLILNIIWIRVLKNDIDGD